MENTRPIRWWPLYLILGLAAANIIYRLTADSLNRQGDVMAIMFTVIIAALASILWLLFLSAMPWKKRFLGLGGVIGMLLLSSGLFKVQGFDGDFTPLVEWRWSGSEIAGDRADALAAADSSNWVSDRDFLQFLGPDRNGIIRNVALESDWQQAPPKLLWRQPIGEGWSSFVVAGNYAITQEQRGENEMVVCYELLTGKTLWQHADAERYESTVAGSGPRATASVANGRVFTVGSTGLLNCLDLHTGKKIWSKNVLADNDSKALTWGFSRSPLLADSLVIMSAGGANGRSLVAYHQEDGRLIWSGGSSGASYSAPQPMTLAGVDQILIFNQGILSGHDANSGALLWEQPWRGKDHPCVAQPLRLGDDQVFISSGYGHGCGLYQITRNGDSFQSTKIYETPRMKNKFTTSVYKDGYLFGLDDGVLACVDPSDGQRKWKKGRYGHGQLLLVGDILLILTEDGELVLVKADPEKFTELARDPGLEGQTWNIPTFANPYLLVRNNKEAACYELKTRKLQDVAATM